jgi:hypothetical protein
MKKLFTAIVAAMALWSCDKPGKDTDAIIVKNSDALTQTVFADRTNGSSDVTFTTTGAWSSSAMERASGTRMNVTPTVPAEWLWLDPSSGDAAGEYTVAVVLEPNTTGADRVAAIKISSEGQSVFINVRQKGVTEDGEVPKNPNDTGQLLLNALNGYEPAYARMVEAWVGMDDSFGALMMRQTNGLIPSTPALWDFWEEAYEVINLSNTVFELVDTTDTKSAEEINRCKGRAAMYRGMAYLYLTTLFGEVPVATYGMSWKERPASTVADINDFIDNELYFGIERLSGDELAKLFFAIEVFSMQTGDFKAAAAMPHAILDNMSMSFPDTNGDGLLNANDSEETIRSAQACLLGAEACDRLDRTTEAVEWLNVILQADSAELMQPGGDVRAMINQMWSAWNKGVKFMNLVRWGGTAGWGQYALLPIPAQAMSANKLLTQNPGW